MPKKIRVTEHNKTEHTEATLTEAIHRTWPYLNIRPRYVVAVQVNNGAGYAYRRTLDAIVFDTWPSSGLTLHGLEIKITKSDLRRELQDTKKYADFSLHLDYFSIVAPKGIVDLRLLPPKWGLFQPTEDGKLRARRKPLSIHDGSRKTISRSMTAAFVRALVSRSLSQEVAQSEYKRGMKSGEQHSKLEIEKLSRNLDSLKQSVSEFEVASGVKITSWNGEKIGEAVHCVLAGGLEQRVKYAGNIRGLGEKIMQLADELDSLKQGYDKSEKN